MSEPKAISRKIKNVASKKFNKKSMLHKTDLSKLDASEDTMSYYTYPKEFLKLNLDKIREFIEILEEHYQNVAVQDNISEAKAVKQRLILLKNLEKEKMKKEAKIIYSNQRELVENKMKEELDKFLDSSTKEFNSLIAVFENQEVELLKAQKQEMNELKKNFDYIYESRKPKPSKEMLNWLKIKDYAVKQNKFDKAEDAEKEIEELQKKENEKLEKEKGNVLKEEIKKLAKIHEDEKNVLLKRKNNFINAFNKNKNQYIEQIKKKYETKMKELKNYQSFEISNFDKITKGITKPSYRIQDIVNSTALIGENENNEIENESEGNIKEEFNKNGIKNKEIPENKIPDNAKEAIDFSYAMKCELFSVSSKNNIKVNELFEKIALIHIKNKNFDEVYCEFSLSKNQSLYSFSNKTFSNYNYYNADNGSVNRGLESLEQEKSFKLKILKKDYNKGKEFNLKNKKNGFLCKI